MKATACFLAFCWMTNAVSQTASPQVLVDGFPESLPAEWTWEREDSSAWKLSEGELRLRILPGNMWGGANDARNVLVIPAGDPGKGALTASVVVENRPTEQYEQVDLVWFYDDSHMVKIGLEQVDGKLTIVMGREEKDRTRTLTIDPIEKSPVRLKLTVRDKEITGEYRFPGETEWTRAGQCDLPGTGEGKISLQAYQGPANQERWARLTEFRLVREARE